MDQARGSTRERETPTAPRPRRRRRGSRALLFGLLCVVGTALPAAPGAAAPTSVAVAEAEQGSFDGWNIRKVPDTAASGDSAVRFDWTGSLRLNVTLSADADAMTLRLRGDQCAGAPAYTVTVDNEPAAEGTVASTSWSRHAHAAALAAGTHALEVRFTNDHLQPWPDACDRNLYLDTITFSASGTGAPQANPPVPAGFVHQSGTRLLDGADKPIRLRGVNLGGWLLWEGWLWGQGFDYIGESAMMRNLAMLVGSSEAEQFRSGVRANYITVADFKAMSAHGFNVARVPFNYRLLEDDAQPFAYKQSGWDILDRTVSAAKQHSVYLVLDMHAAPCSQMYAFVSDFVGPDFLWSSQKCQDRMVAMWKAIAARYAKRNIIAGYDLLGETIIGDQQLLGLYKRATAAIREVDKNHLLIYEGNNMARTFDLFRAPLDSNQALSFHDYSWAFPGEDLTTRMIKYDAAAKRLNSPQWVGEFGQSTYADVKHYVDIFDKDPLVAGWALWVWKQVPGFAPVQAIQHTPASKKLVEWMNDTSRPRPTGADATQGMSEFIRAMRFENTVHDAKLRRVLDCRYNCTPAETAALAASTRRVSLAAALRKGIKVWLTAPGPGRLKGAARRAGKVLARGAATTPDAGRRAVRLRFTSQARRALRGMRRVRLVVRVTYVPARGLRVSQRLKVTLKR
jgi:endoglucanase